MSDIDARKPLITLGQGLNLGLVVVLLGAAWQLGEKMAEMRVNLAEAKGEIAVLAERIRSLSMSQERMQTDLTVIRSEVNTASPVRAVK